MVWSWKDLIEYIFFLLPNKNYFNAIGKISLISI